MIRSNVLIEALALNVSMQVRRWRELREFAELLRDLVVEVTPEAAFEQAKLEQAPRGAELKAPSIKISIPPGSGDGLQVAVRAVNGNEMVQQQHTLPGMQLRGWDGLNVRELRQKVESLLTGWYKELVVLDWRKVVKPGSVPAELT